MLYIPRKNHTVYNILKYDIHYTCIKQHIHTLYIHILTLSRRRGGAGEVPEFVMIQRPIMVIVNTIKTYM